MRRERMRENVEERGRKILTDCNIFYMVDLVVRRVSFSVDKLKSMAVARCGTEIDATPLI